MVLSQLEMSNLGCWGPGESIGTQYVEFQRKKKFRIFIRVQFLFRCLLLYKILLGFVKKSKKFEFPAKFKMGLQDPLEGLSQLKNVESWLLRSMGVHRHPYGWVL